MDIPASPKNKVLRESCSVRNSGDKGGGLVFVVVVVSTEEVVAGGNDECCISFAVGRCLRTLDKYIKVEAVIAPAIKAAA